MTDKSGGKTNVAIEQCLAANEIEPNCDLIVLWIPYSHSLTLVDATHTTLPHQTHSMDPDHGL